MECRVKKEGYVHSDEHVPLFLAVLPNGEERIWCENCVRELVNNVYMYTSVLKEQGEEVGDRVNYRFFEIGKERDLKIEFDPSKEPSEEWTIRFNARRERTKRDLERLQTEYQKTKDEYDEELFPDRKY